MKPAIPYLTFPRCCREAMTFYADVLGGDLTVMTTLGESPIDVPPGAEALIFNSEVRAGDLVLKGSDNPEYAGGVATVSLFLSFDDATERQRVFDMFATEGTVIFEVDGPFAMVADRYGTQWMLTTAD